jgi:hypothetical protein
VQRDEWHAGRGIILASGALVLLLGWGVFSRCAIQMSPSGGSLLLAALPLGTALFILWLCGYAAVSGRVATAPAAADPWHSFPHSGQTRRAVRGASVQGTVEAGSSR